MECRLILLQQNANSIKGGVMAIKESVRGLESHKQTLRR